MKLIEVAFFTDRVDAEAAFFEALLGHPPAHRGPDIAIFQDGGLQILVHTKSGSAADGPPNEDHLAFGAPDVDAACAELESRGYRMELAPRDYDWGRSAYLRDPDGRLIEIHQG